MKFYIAVLALVGLLCSGCTKDEHDSKHIAMEQNKTIMTDDNKSDVRFVVMAADGGLLEVKTAQLMQSQGRSPQVISFARQMEQDHTNLNNELKGLASQQSITLPGTLSAKTQGAYDDLAQKQGNDLDKAYMDMMVDDHKKDIDHFEKEASEGNIAAVKQWANASLPTLRHHLEMAQQVKDNLK